MPFEFEVMNAVRIAAEIRAIDLRRERERGPPAVTFVADDRTDVERGVLPFLIFRQFVVIACFNAKPLRGRTCAS